jgi:hypothetical protein
LVVFRLAGMMLFAPLFGSSRIPRRVKALLVIILALGLMPSVSRTTALPETTWGLALGIGGEVICGPAVGRVVDVLQVPAFLARQTDLLLACGRTGKVVNVKKGQFMAPAEMGLAVEKVKSTGNGNVMLTERGTFFGYGRLVNDFTALAVMKGFGCPVVFDATHSTQQPAGLQASRRRQSSSVWFQPACSRRRWAAGISAPESGRISITHLVGRRQRRATTK